MNVVDLIDQELTRASAPKASRKPVFLFLKDGQKATVRPLYNYSDMLVLLKHNKWSDNPATKVNAICAKEIGESCWHCEKASSDRKLTAAHTFYLPIYVASVIDTKTGKQVTYKEKVDEQEVEKPVQGIRILELTSFGTISSVLKYFRGIFRDPDYGYDITGCDYTVEQVGAGQGKDFTVITKPAKPLDPRLQKATPTPEQIKQRILEACPPLTGVESNGSNGHVSAASTEGEDDECPPF